MPSRRTRLLALALSRAMSRSEACYRKRLALANRPVCRYKILTCYARSPVSITARIVYTASKSNATDTGGHSFKYAPLFLVVTLILQVWFDGFVALAPLFFRSAFRHSA